MRSTGRCRRRREHRFDVRRRTSAGRWPAIRCSFWRAERQTRSPERTPDCRLDVTRLSAFSAKLEKAARRKQHHRWRSSDCSTAETRTNVHASGLAAEVTTRSAAFIQFLANRAHARSVGSLAWLPAAAMHSGEPWSGGGSVLDWSGSVACAVRTFPLSAEKALRRVTAGVRSDMSWRARVCLSKRDRTCRIGRQDPHPRGVYAEAGGTRA